MNETNEFPAAREYLGQVRKAEKHVEWLRQRVANLRMLLTDTAVHLTKTPGSGSLETQKNEALYAEIDSLEREIAEAEDAVKAIRTEVGMMICRIQDPIAQKVLILHYLDRMPWRNITSKIGFSETHMYRFRDMGYAELEKLLENE